MADEPKKTPTVGGTPSATATAGVPKTTSPTGGDSGGSGGSGGKGGSLTDTIIQNGRLARDPTQVARAKQILAEFVNQVAAAPKGSVGNDVYSFIVSRISQVDRTISAQMDQIVQNPDFQKFEASWRGLNKLVMGTETGERLKLKLWVITKQELMDDLERAVEFDQSQLFKKVYEEQYGTYGGTPFSCLMGDFEFGRDPMDVELATLLSNVAACAHTPFLAAASPGMFNFDSFMELSGPRDLSKLFDGTDAIKWRSFRQTDDSRYFTLTMPHVLMRLPYGANTNPVEGFDYEESVDGTDNTKFCWGNAAYALAQNITTAFSLYGWTAAIRGVEGGGLVSDLPAYTFKTADGDLAVKCPTEIAITDRREKELSDLGFMSLCYCKNTDYAAFFSAQTTQEPIEYNDNNANANARISARLPYMLNASRFAHYIKSLMRDKIGSFMSRQEVSLYLNSWIAQYILLSDVAPEAVKASFPLREGRVDVSEVPGKPGSYTAVIFLRPFFQLEELTASLRLVATLPRPGAG
jgi:type VI secretion system protein ImpC